MLNWPGKETRMLHQLPTKKSLKRGEVWWKLPVQPALCGEAPIVPSILFLKFKWRSIYNFFIAIIFEKLLRPWERA
jgi:hypothetical protein